MTEESTINQLNNKLKKALLEYNNAEKRIKKFFKNKYSIGYKRNKIIIENSKEIIDSTRKEMLQYKDKMTLYCTFNEKIIIEILSKYISFIEKNDYVFFDNVMFGNLTDFFLVKKDYDLNELNNIDAFYEAILHKDVIVIKSINVTNDLDKVFLYNVVIENDFLKIFNNLYCQYFDYIYDILDIILNYRINNSLEDINDLDIKKILDLVIKQKSKQNEIVIEKK